ncbi:hypothetical protein M23134_03792 [Microscilla marina ATCC 23134]|uniref:Uncharacterized protein n=1 Tax=Microscilla marina ATCC 23134 TaxID=313606 RepID=A1ZPI4_MICM2|nr:hypothetical protein M23134_03792 [Microscilla marina ATCC 23134]
MFGRVGYFCSFTKLTGLFRISQLKFSQSFVFVILRQLHVLEIG